MEKEKKERYLLILCSALLAVCALYFFSMLITLLFNQSWAVLSSFFCSTALALLSFFGFALMTAKKK